MNEETKQIIEVITSHPKVSIGLVAASQANIRWMDYVEPYIKDTTNILGIAVLFLLVVKHSISVYKELFSKDKG